MVNLEALKDQLHTQLAQAQAEVERLENVIGVLEEQDADVLNVLIPLLQPKATPSSRTVELVQCDICGKDFKASGIKRHKTVAHG